MGPLLFLLFINDLSDKIRHQTRLFADDCIVYRPINGPEDCAILQQDLHALADWEHTWGMEFHPKKYSIMSILRARSKIKHQYILKGHTLEVQDATKYLGVDQQSTLSWKLHIDRISKKANSMLGFLRRNLRSCSEDTKAKAYYSMVRSNLEYCTSIWNPHHKDQTRKLEMVQRRAARYTTNFFRNTSSVSSMLEHLQWESLESRRVKIQLTLFYKVVNNLVHIPAADYLVPSMSRTRASHSKRYRQFSTSSDFFKFSFFPRTVPSWNSLPATVAEAHSLVSFKEGLSTLLF